MVTMTQSLEVWLLKYHKEKLLLIMFGHTELFTEEMRKDYLTWCLTNEGRQYLKGGSKYDENHKGNKVRGGLNNARLDRKPKQHI